jgi:hypothetical protein
MPRRLACASLVVALSLTVAGCKSTPDGGGGLAADPTAQTYDLVLLGGRVMDPETNFDAVRNVGIKDGRIAAITEAAIEGTDTLDAKGLVVAPGFIDTHTHSSDKFAIKMAMMDGVTSAMDYELGSLNVGAWYEREAGKWPINYGQVVSHEFVRMVVHDGMKLDGPQDAYDVFRLRAESVKDEVPGWSVTVSDLDQINQITKILDENLRQGALGVGSTVGYAGRGVSTYEMFEVQRAAARYGRPIAAHHRFHTLSKPPTEAAHGFNELFTNAFLLKAPLLMCHNNDYGWWEIEEKLSLAREQGLNMWSEYYPYAAGSTAIAADMLRPESLEDTLGLKYSEVMFDPSQNKYLTKNEYLTIVKEDPGRTVIVFNPPRKRWMLEWPKVPHMVVASDGMWSTNPEQTWDTDPAEFSGHPRTSGTHTKVLRMARELNVPLMFTLKQLSYWSALHLGEPGLEFMQERGRVQVGKVADLVLFDADAVKEGSGYETGKNGLPPIGLPHVLVNGQFVKRDGKATDVMAGQPIRYPVEETPRHVPATTEQWKDDFLIDTGTVKPRK